MTIDQNINEKFGSNMYTISYTFGWPFRHTGQCWAWACSLSENSRVLFTFCERWVELDSLFEKQTWAVWKLKYQQFKLNLQLNSFHGLFKIFSAFKNKFFNSNTILRPTRTQDDSSLIINFPGSCPGLAFSGPTRVEPNLFLGLCFILLWRLHR